METTLEDDVKQVIRISIPPLRKNKPFSCLKFRTDFYHNNFNLHYSFIWETGESGDIHMCRNKS